MDQNQKEMMKQEAIRRMEILEIMPEVVKKFACDDIIYYSEDMGNQFSGILFYLSNHPKYLEQVRTFEKETRYLVYHAVLTHFTSGDVLDLLYLSNQENEGEWEEEREELKQGYADIYAINLSDRILSEFGSAKYEPKNGGVKKLW